MSIQEMKCPSSSLFYLGAFKLMEQSESMRAVMSSMFGDLFADPVGDWPEIRMAFEMFGAAKLQLNSGFSKDVEQGDGTKLPWGFTGRGNGEIAQIFRACEKMGVLKDADSCRVSFSAVLTPDESRALMKWRGLTRAYEAIKEIETSLVTTALAVFPLLGGIETIERSPAQLALYRSKLCPWSLAHNGKYGDAPYPFDLYLGSPVKVVLEPIGIGTLQTIFEELIDALNGFWDGAIFSIQPKYFQVSEQVAELEMTADDLNATLNPEMRLDPGYANVLHYVGLIALVDGETPGCFDAVESCGDAFDYFPTTYRDLDGRLVVYKNPPFDPATYAVRYKTITAVP